MDKCSYCEVGQGRDCICLKYARYRWWPLICAGLVAFWLLLFIVAVGFV